jgi:hypothetical protein
MQYAVLQAVSVFLCKCMVSGGIILDLRVGSVQSFWGDLLCAWVTFPLHFLMVRGTTVLLSDCVHKFW